jgi:hypothetical protein
MQAAVINTANKSSLLLQISRQEWSRLGLIGFSNEENTIRANPERRAPQIPYQNTAFSTFTSYCLNIFY